MVLLYSTAVVSYLQEVHGFTVQYGSGFLPSGSPWFYCTVWQWFPTFRKSMVLLYSTAVVSYLQEVHGFTVQYGSGFLPSGSPW